MKNRRKLVVASVSGKDSTAMVLEMLRRGEAIDYLVSFLAPWEFPEMHGHVFRLSHDTDIDFCGVRPATDWDTLLNRYGWPHPCGGWCCASKRDAINRWVRSLHADEVTECIGFATGEEKRAQRDTLVKKKNWRVRFPLLEWGITEPEALEICYANDYDFGGLYEWMPSQRVSCFCCPKQSVQDLRAIVRHRPRLHEVMLRMDGHSGKRTNFKSKRRLRDVLVEVH